MSTKSKKYKLFSASDADGGKRPCAFFGTPEGCRKGDSCPFLHSSGGGVVPPGTPPDGCAAVVNTNNSVVSSESEGEIEDPMRKIKKQQQQQQQQAKAKTDEEQQQQITPKEETTTTTTTATKSKKKRKNKRKRDPDAPIFAKPKGQQDGSFKYADLLDDDKPSTTKTTTTTTTTTTAAASSPQPKQKKAKRNQETVSILSSSNFRDLNLPVANFMLSSDGKEQKATSKQKETAATVVAATAPVVAPKEEKSSISKKYPGPVSTEIGRKWIDVVDKTQTNPEFASIFDFKKYKEQDIPGDVWVKSKPFGEWCASNPQAIAIDCEMCETTDPVSGQKNHAALCRISIVNAEDPDDVLLNTLVKPSWPVTDYRTFVNGITKEHLESVQFTLRHAQAFLVALCSEETVILGHAVHNDLASIRLEHYCVGDSALLFKAKDSPTATVSLKDLALNILQKEMPPIHDSVNDAITAMKCLDHYRINKGQVDEIVRTPKQQHHRDGTSGNRTHHKLFVHRIPKFCNATHLAKMFLQHTSIAPDDVDEIDFSGSKGKTHVSFRSTRHAGLVFDTLEGTAEKETSGRLQKKVWLRDGDYVQVRKMAFEKGHQFPDGTEAK